VFHKVVWQHMQGAVCTYAMHDLTSEVTRQTRVSANLNDVLLMLSVTFYPRDAMLARH